MKIATPTYRKRIAYENNHAKKKFAWWPKRTTCGRIAFLEFVIRRARSSCYNEYEWIYYTKDMWKEKVEKAKANKDDLDISAGK